MTRRKIANSILIIIVVSFLFFISRKVLKQQIFFGFAVDKNPVTYEIIESIQSETGVIPGIVLFFHSWFVDNQPSEFPLTSLNTIADIGAMPCITWEPTNFTEQGSENVSYDMISTGCCDDYIRTFAIQSRIWGHPYMLRFAHEMNLSQYHWGTTQEYNATSPEKYVKMFRHIVNIFREENAYNVFFVFCPNVVSVPNEAWNVIKNYYPGDEFVDIFGIDGYNWFKKNDPKIIPPEQLFHEAYRQLKALNNSLPIFIFETAAYDNKALWLEEIYKTAKMYHIQGVVWFQTNKEHEWKLTLSQVKSIAKFTTRPFTACDWLQKLYDQKAIDLQTRNTLIE